MNIEAFRKFDLTGKTALVTGGGTGIGYQISRALARSGARVMIAARREDVLAGAAGTLSEEAFGAEVLHETVDLADRASIAALAARAGQRMGGVDIYVGNAGQECLEHLENIQDESIDLMLQVNVSANVELTRALLPHMKRNRWGRIILCSSVVGSAATADGSGMYCAVKGALNAFARAAAVETGQYGITVNTLVIGLFLTDMLMHAAATQDQMAGEGAGQAFLDGLGSMVALGRPCKVEEMEGLIQLLASDAGSAITAANLPIDGGMLAMLRPNEVVR